MEHKAELLAPVGTEENFYAAINYGADAIYLGLTDFSARKNAGNFALEKLPYYLSYAHLFDVKVYVAVNTVIKNSELPHYFDVISKAYAMGVDAFIVQDIFLGRKLKKLFPEICLHLSTQAGVNNTDGAKQALSYGFSRVILARETPIEEIKKITAIIETEVFVHGALCTCFSGHCYFSSFIGGNSGNRGLCRQPCRKLYKYTGKSVNDNLRYALSLSDLSLYKRIDDLITAGVKSFKIEGRMRSFEYVCASCDFYADILKGEFNRRKFENLLKTYNRGGYTEGLTFGQDKSLISDKIQNHAGLSVGKVLSVSKDKIIPSNLKTDVHEGDCFKIISDGKETGNATAANENGKIVIKFKQKAFAGSTLSITKDCSLIEKYKLNKRLYKLNVRMILKAGYLPEIIINDQKFTGNALVQKAQNYPLTKSEIKDNLRKTDVYPFEVTPSCEMDGDVFLPKKDINALRANAYKTFFYQFEHKNIKTSINQYFMRDFNDNYVTHDFNGGQIALISDSFNLYFLKSNGISKIVFCPSDYNDENEFKTFLKSTAGFGGKRYLYIPAFLTFDDEKIVSSVSAPFDGLYSESASGLFLAKRLKKEFFGGIELNITNSLSLDYLIKEGAVDACFSKELSVTELSELFKIANARVLSGGVIKLMSLCYCPFGKKCFDCNRPNVFSLKDENNRIFKVRRYKLSSCRFEIYNNALLYSKKRFKSEIYDFTTLTETEKEKLSAIYFTDKKWELEIPYTSGNLNKGVE